MKDIKLLDLFAGIGGFRLAAQKAAKNLGLGFSCVGFSEIDKFATKSYKAFYPIKDEIELGDICKFTEDQQRIEKLPDFNLMTGGFPCQPFSVMGDQLGFDDHRGGLFFDMLKIIDAKSPDVILLENVNNIRRHDDGRTIAVIERLLREHGYKFVSHDVFNTKNFGLPQTRNRVYILAVKDPPNQFDFSESLVRERFNLIKPDFLDIYTSVIGILEKNTDDKYYLSERIKPTILSSGTGGFIAKSEINQMIARPLTATMVKMHRACQDNYYSDDFILSGGRINDSGLPPEELCKKRIRKISPSEAFALQGFPKKFIRLIESQVSDHQLLKQAGNAVSVNVACAIFIYVLMNTNKGDAR